MTLSKENDRSLRDDRQWNKWRIIGLQKERKKSWLSKKSWELVEDGKQLKTSIELAKSERIKQRYKYYFGNPEYIFTHWTCDRCWISSQNWRNQHKNRDWDSIDYVKNEKAGGKDDVTAE